MTTGYWIALGTIANIVITLIFGYWRNPPLVPSSTLAELRETVKELRSRVDELQDENKGLTEANADLERSRAFWQNETERLLRQRGRTSRPSE